MDIVATGPKIHYALLEDNVVEVGRTLVSTSLFSNGTTKVQISRDQFQK
jgi:hypothetical protein